NTPLCVIAAAGRPVVTFDVNEADLARIYGGQYASIQPGAFPQQRLTGRVKRIGQARQARGGAAFPVTVEVISPLGRVRPGMSVRVTLLEKQASAGQRSAQGSEGRARRAEPAPGD
ncbi:MAG: HlyD family efflux transporter periplasmic adaptor subunit, partial [Armatimonadota bacterium]|nr:HlyD family efflux transporter periplasmic adaptor subunit [Armatimonadota bacterium]